MSALWIDHAIYAVPDLDAAGARFAERVGLGSVPGGRHRGWGTANRIVPLGRSYLELITVVDPDEAAASAFGGAVMQALDRREPLTGWVVATDDIDEIARRLGLEVERRSRARPDGSTLGWRLAGMDVAMETGALPFFIEWDGPPEHHPGAAIAEHRTEPRGIAWVEVAVDRGRLRDWLGHAELPVRISDGPPSVKAVAIATTAGELVVR